jgi:hypothetical protein
MSGVGDEAGGVEEVEPPPHPQTPIAAAITSATAPGCNLWAVNDPGRPSVPKYCMFHLRSRIDGLARVFGLMRSHSKIFVKLVIALQGVLQFTAEGFDMIAQPTF